MRNQFESICLSPEFKSFRVYNSLGEAYLNNGDYQLAIQNYKKSLELNPRNKNAEKRLKEISNKKIIEK